MTVKQSQYLLLYLGYDIGEADGIWGEKCKQAVKQYQQEYGGLTVDGVCGALTEAALKKAVAENWQRKKDDFGPKDDFWAGISSFTKQEFACKCGKCGGFPEEPKEKLVRLAQRVRDHFCKPVTVSSGVRCVRHNQEVGGVFNSFHLSGRAMDFCVEGVDGETVLDYVKQQPEIHYAYHIGGGYVHMDVA